MDISFRNNALAVKLRSILLMSVIFFFSFACSVENDRTINPKTVHAQGGVDVGNMSSTTSQIPETLATLTYPDNWNGKTINETLLITNSVSSSIKASKSDIRDLVAPTQFSLISYLKSKYPERKYSEFEVNGLKGVRAEISNSALIQISDMYLISEYNDFIHIVSTLNEADSGILEGEKIISTVRLKYLGEPVVNAVPKTVVLNSNFRKYSFSGNCYSNTTIDYKCRGVSVDWNGINLSIGNKSVNDSGRIVELESENIVSFDSIFIDEEYLIAPETKVPITDIYTTFTPKNKNVELKSLALKEGFIYLIRVAKWPLEDIILKMKVNSITGSELVFTYQELVAVKPDVLQQQVELINKRTKENEMPISEGEVTLHNESVWNNTSFASFNFQYSTSGNGFIIQDIYNRDNWDITFSNECGGKPSLTIPRHHLSRSKIFSFDSQTLDKIEKQDFPSPYGENKTCVADLKVGQIYGVLNHTFDKFNGRAVYGAVQILDLDKAGNWVRLKFRRISAGKAEHIQTWTPIDLPQTSISQLDKVNKHWLFPYGNEFRMTHDFVGFETSEDGIDFLSASNQLFVKERGLINLSKDINFDKLSIDDLENRIGTYNTKIEIHAGDVIGIFLENYNHKTGLVLRVIEHVKGKSFKYEAKFLYRASANPTKKK